MLRLETISLSIGGHDLLVDADLHVHEGDRIGLVGRNGSGKSTLLRAIAGELDLDGGRIAVRGDVQVGYLPQQAVSGSTRPLWEEVASGMVRLNALAERLAHANQAVAEGVEGAVAQAGEAEEAFRIAGGYAREERIGEILHGLGFRPEDWQNPCDTFSGGWQMRIALARLLLSDATLLLLDEPTNHLDLVARTWLTGFLKATPHTVVLVSHDRHVIDSVVTRICEVRNLDLETYTGTLSKWLVERDLRSQQQAQAYARQQEEIAKLERFVDRFKAKATKASQARSRMKALERMERIEAPEHEQRPRYALPAPPPSSTNTLTLKKAALGWTETPVLTEVDLVISRGMRIAILGPNGSGKSTLLHALSGRLGLIGGRRIVGDRVRIGVFTQDLAQDLPADQTGLDVLSSMAPTAELPRVWGALGALGLGGEKAKQTIQSLSGGEKARVALAGFALKPHNVLLLDEPTNHLDAVAVEALAGALKDFEGTLIVVSHDRWLVEQVATHVISVQDGCATFKEGLAPEDFQFTARKTARVEKSVGAEAWAEKKQRARERERAVRRVKKIGEELEGLETEIVALDEQLYATTDYEKSAAIAVNRDALQARVDALYAEWEALESEVDA